MIKVNMQLITMEKYKNRSGDSGVYAYTIGADYIIVQFRTSATPYTYSYARAGARHVEAMKKLARAGKGLSSYITRHVRDAYDK